MANTWLVLMVVLMAIFGCASQSDISDKNTTAAILLQPAAAPSQVVIPVAVQPQPQIPQPIEGVEIVPAVPISQAQPQPTAQLTVPIPAPAPTVSVSTTPSSWRIYCSEMQDANEKAACNSADQKAQITFLLSIVNGSRAAPTLNVGNTGIEAWLLSLYPQGLYERFGCVNTNMSEVVTPGHWTAGYRWVPTVITTVLNLSDGAKFYWVNLTSNTQLNYLYNDSMNNTWNCTWRQIEYTPFAVPTLDCATPAEADWMDWCTKNGMSCDVNPQEKLRIEQILASSSSSNQWKCQHQTEN